MKARRWLLGLTVVAVLPAVAGIGAAAEMGAWSAATSAETAGTASTLNTNLLEGCPSVARDDRELFFASNRPGGQGGLDLYVATRAHAGDPWGVPANLGSTINTASNELCPTPLRDGHGFLFISNRPNGCGNGDIYVSREHAGRGWAAPRNLGCSINSAGDEASPFVVRETSGSHLYFSSTRGGGFSSAAPDNDADIYVSAIRGFSVGAPELVDGINTASQDARPNLRRDGLEIFFDSDRPGGFGNADLWTASRARADESWGAPQNLGTLVNSSAADLRPSLSWDGATLYFGSTRTGEGSSDLYMTTRARDVGR